MTMKLVRSLPAVLLALCAGLSGARQTAAPFQSNPGSKPAAAKATAVTSAPRTSAPGAVKQDEGKGAATKLDPAEAMAKLAGDWESVKRSMGGLGVTFHFTADGSVTMSPGALVDYQYTLTGNHLVMRMVNPADPAAQPEMAEVHIEGDTMSQKSTSGGSDIKLVRLTPVVPGAPAIVGKWGRDPAALVESEPETPQLKAARETMARNYTNEYTADGKMHLRIPFISRKGTYTIEGDLLHMRYADGRPSDARFQFKGGKLFLSRQDGGRTHTDEFQRADLNR